MFRPRLESIPMSVTSSSDRLILRIDSTIHVWGMGNIKKIQKTVWVGLKEESSYLVMPTTPGGNYHRDYFSRPIFRIIVIISWLELV